MRAPTSEQHFEPKSPIAQRSLGEFGASIAHEVKREQDRG